MLSSLAGAARAGEDAMIPAAYGRAGAGFRETFDRLAARGYATYVPGLVASHPSDRAFAATMLGVVGDPRAIPLLTTFVAGERDEPARHGALVGLVLLGERRHLGDLLAALARDLAGYPGWITTGVPANALASAARSLRVLAEYDVALPAGVVDGLFHRLDHADPGVRIDAAAALGNATGIGFGFRGDVSDAAAERPRAEAWRQWWKANRARYEAKRNYVVHGLELVLARDGGRHTATFHNRGAGLLRLPAPAAALVRARRETPCAPAGPSLSLVDARGGVLRHLRSEPGPCSAHFLAEDVLRWDTLDLAPGAAHAFGLPAVDATAPFALAYAAPACGPGRWCGELRSNVIPSP